MAVLLRRCFEMRVRRSCSAEAPGLACAFHVRASARLVSHWEVNFDAMPKLITGASVTGPLQSIPFLRLSTAGVMLLSGVSAGLPPDGVRRGRGRSNLR